MEAAVAAKAMEAAVAAKFTMAGRGRDVTTRTSDDDQEASTRCLAQAGERRALKYSLQCVLLSKFDVGNATTQLASDPDIIAMLQPLLSRPEPITIGLILDGKTSLRLTPAQLGDWAYSRSWQSLFQKMGHHGKPTVLKQVSLLDGMEMCPVIDTTDIILFAGVTRWYPALTDAFEKETHRDVRPPGHRGIVSYIQKRVSFGFSIYWGICGGAMAAGQKITASSRQEWLEGLGPDGFRLLSGLTVDYAWGGPDKVLPMSEEGHVKITNSTGLIVRVSPVDERLKALSLAGKRVRLWKVWEQEYNKWLHENVKGFTNVWTDFVDAFGRPWRWKGSGVVFWPEEGLYYCRLDGAADWVPVSQEPCASGLGQS